MNILFLVENYYSNKNEWSDDDNNHNFDEINYLQELSHTKIINSCVFHYDHLINAQLLSEKSLLQQEMPIWNKQTLLYVSFHRRGVFYGTDLNSYKLFCDIIFAFILVLPCM
jgi:hypothetical protein